MLMSVYSFEELLYAARDHVFGCSNKLIKPVLSGPKREQDVLYDLYDR